MKANKKAAAAGDCSIIKLQSPATTARHGYGASGTVTSSTLSTIQLTVEPEAPLLP